MQLGDGEVEGVVGPQQVQDLFPVQAVVRLERQQLDQVGGVLARPRGHDDVVDDHLEPTEELDPDGPSPAFGRPVTHVHVRHRRT